MPCAGTDSGAWRPVAGLILALGTPYECTSNGYYVLESPSSFGTGAGSSARSTMSMSMRTLPRVPGRDAAKYEYVCTLYWCLSRAGPPVPFLPFPFSCFACWRQRRAHPSIHPSCERDRVCLSFFFWGGGEACRWSVVLMEIWRCASRSVVCKFFFL